MSIESIQQGWDAVYNDRLQRASQTQDPALRAHFQAELNVMQQTMQALKAGSNAVPPSTSGLPAAPSDLPGVDLPMMDDGANTNPLEDAPTGVAGKNPNNEGEDPLSEPIGGNDALPSETPPADGDPASIEEMVADRDVLEREIANDPEAQEKWVDMQTDAALASATLSF